MKSISKGAVIAISSLTAAIAVAGGASAASAHKVKICHGTASDSNPYVVISVDRSALAGHFDGTAPGHGWKNHPDLMYVGGVCTAVADGGGDAGDGGVGDGSGSDDGGEGGGQD
jgi:hypothetical protein